jgi:hypothetical protein
LAEFWSCIDSHVCKSLFCFRSVCCFSGSKSHITCLCHPLASGISRMRFFHTAPSTERSLVPHKTSHGFAILHSYSLQPGPPLAIKCCKSQLFVVSPRFCYMIENSITAKPRLLITATFQRVRFQRVRFQRVRISSEASQQSRHTIKPYTSPPWVRQGVISTLQRVYCMVVLIF